MTAGTAAEGLGIGVLAAWEIPWVSVVLLLTGLGVLGVVLVQAARSGGLGRALRWGVAPIVAPEATPRGGAAESRELEDLVRQLASELDDRAARLERLIAAADERLVRLERGEKSPTRRATDSHGGAREPESKSAARLVIREEGDPVTRRIYTLADEGLGAVEIARRVEQPTGKIELILALRGR